MELVATDALRGRTWWSCRLWGLVALVAGVTTLVDASEAMLATLVAAMVTLRVVTTVRHAVAGQTGADGQRDPGNPWTGPHRRDVRT
jgi:uncharacterized membrane protein HdeD (DUF308 family)